MSNLKIDSPFIAKWALQKTVKNSEDHFFFFFRSSRPTLKNFHMDDYLDSFPTTQKTINRCWEIIKTLSKIKISFRKPIFSGPDVLPYLAMLHRQRVIDPMDKAGNDFTFVSKEFYLPKTIAQFGEYNNMQSSFTYSKTSFSKDDIIKVMKTIVKKLTLSWQAMTALLELHLYLCPKVALLNHYPV